MKRFSASHARSWTECRRRAWCDLHIQGRGLPIERYDRLIMELGDAHEESILRNLADHVVARDSHHTKELIATKTAIIYQPKIERDDLQLISQPDFLILEDASYRVCDAKLARSIRQKKDIQIQLGTYQIATETELPAKGLLPNGVEEEIFEGSIDLAWTFINDMQRLLTEDEMPEADFVSSKCDKCRYRNCAPSAVVGPDWVFE